MKCLHLLLFLTAFSFMSLQAQIETVTDTVLANQGDEAVSTDKSESDEVFTFVEEYPSYPGGEEAFFKFLDANMNYPTLAREQGIQGKVWTKFVIDSIGKVMDITIARGIGGGCDEEAIRVLKLMPNWIPGKIQGRPVKCQFTFPINFVLQDDNVIQKKEKKKKKNK